MKQRLFRTRRLGVALIAGVTALGAAATFGEGVAGASAPSGFTLTSTSYVTGATSNWTASFVPTTALAAAGTITLTIGGTTAGTEPTVPAVPSVTLGSNFAGCTATATGTQAVTGTSAATINVTLANATGATCAVTALAATTFTVDGITNGTTPATGVTGASLGTIKTSADTTAVAAANAVTFTLPTTTVTQVPPATAVAPGTANAAINNLSIAVPAASAVNLYSTTAPTDLCLTITTPNVSWETAYSGAGTVTQSNGASTATVAPVGTAAATVGTPTAPIEVTSTATTVAEFQLQSAGNLSATVAPTFVLSNLHANVPTTVTSGPVLGTLSYTTTAGATNSTANCAAATPLVTGAVLFTVSSAPSAPIYGQTAEATAAQEYEAAVAPTPAPGSSVSCNNNGNAIIATSADPYDALSAAYLEGQLHTGVLITPASTTGAIDPNVLQALQYTGVTRVYIVGGPLAVTPQEVATLQATPAYQCGGLTKTGSNLVVFDNISGATAADTAVAIANYIGTNEGGVGLLPSLTTAYSSASTYNQTTGNASATATASAAPKTAIVISQTDWQDADTIAPIAYHYHIPVILTSPTALSPQAQGELLSLQINQVIAVGGQLALTNPVVSSIQALSVGGAPISVLRIAGADYTQTAADIAMFEGSVLKWSQSTLYVAQGTSQANGWGDSLAAAALAAGVPAGAADVSTSTTMGGILLTVSPTAGEGKYTDAVLKLAGTAPAGLGSGVTSKLVVLGGPLAVTASTITAMQSQLGIS